jgi:hypothetical protein
VAKNDALDKVRKKMQEKKGIKRDPDEFRAPKAKKDEVLRFKFAILPPSEEDLLWYYGHGSHFLEKKVHQCPRIHDDNPCKGCQTGFDLMNETDDKEERKSIARMWLPRTYYAVNVFFPALKTNPEELRGRVMWYSMPKTVFEKMEACIYRDSAGDEDDPQAFGLFYDPSACYLFQLEVSNKGEFNTYEASKFLPKTKAELSSFSKSMSVEEILDQRFDLATRFDARDAAAIEKVVNSVLGGDVEDSSDDEPVQEEVSKPEPEPIRASAADAEDELLDEDTSEAKPEAKPEPEAEAKPKEELVDEEDEELEGLLAEIQSDTE